MRETRDTMGMPAIVELVNGKKDALEKIFDYFTSVDERFSTYKSNSEISKINRGEIQKAAYSSDMKEVLALAEKTKEETLGFFSISKPDGSIDPSGLVKGWAIQNGALLAESLGFNNYYIDIGGDIQSKGTDSHDLSWTVGIRNPFKQHEIIKIIRPDGHGVATSGSYIRGQHIYNPHDPHAEIHDIVSITVIGPNVYEADRYATAAFAMGKDGITFIEKLPSFEGYAIDTKGIATMTSGFNKFTA